MPITLSQDGRALQAKTPLGPDVLIPVALEGEEEVSRPFRFSVEFVSTDHAVSAAALLGKPVGLTIKLPGGGTRHVHGIVRRFSHLGVRRELARYRAELVPHMWVLGLGSESRTFEKKSIPDILKTVITDASATDLKFRIVGSQPPQDYVVQYRETHLDFISRLMEEAGLYYAFEFTDNAHAMVITNGHGGSIPAGTLASVRIGIAAAGGTDLDVVTSLAREYAVHSAKVKIADHALLRADDRSEAKSTLPGAVGVVHDFVGDLGPNDSAKIARRLIELEEAGHDRLTGSGTAVGFTAGTRVKLTGGIVGASGLEVHLLRVQHRLEMGDVLAGSDASASYENDFTAMEASRKYLPPFATEPPSVNGTQTAKIVGSGNEGDIDVDEHGRVLLQFPWDVTGAGDGGKSGHRVHVASVWAGGQWGFVQHPRIGQEVLVEYLEGDPVRPIVTGRVYNSANKPPYALPGDKTQSGWKSQTVGGGSENFNELRFEDKPGEEHVYLQAEKDLQVKVKHDETREVLNDRVTTIMENDTRTVSHGDDKHMVNEGDHLFIVEQGDHTVEVKTGKQLITVKENQETTIESGNRKVTINSGNDTLEVQQGNLKIEVQSGNVTIKAASGKITLDAMQGIELICGQSKMELKPAEVSLKSVQMKLTGDAKIEAGAPMVKIEGQAQAEFKGAMVKIEGQAMTTLKGAIAQVTGDGMLKAGGGLTMIG